MMKQTTHALIMAMTSLMMLAATEASAARFVLDFAGEDVRGQDQVIRLKQELNRTYGNIHWDQYELDGVLVEAKSQYGQGSVELVVDGETQDRARISGDPRDFDLDRAHTYERILLRNYERYSQGSWQLFLNGNIRLNRVIVDAKPTFQSPRHPDRPRPIQSVSLGEFKPDKFLTSTQVIPADIQNVVEVRLTGTDRQVDIQEVIVTYADGRRSNLSDLTGSLYEGQTKRLRIRPGNLDSLRVRATSPIPFGNRGRYAVELGVAEPGSERPRERPRRRRR